MLFGMNLGLDGRFQVEMAMSIHGIDQHGDQRLQAFAVNPGWRARTAPQAAPPELRRAITRARCGAWNHWHSRHSSTIKKAVTTLLRCYNIDCEVTTLLRNPLKPATLLAFGPQVVVVNGEVTNQISRL